MQTLSEVLEGSEKVVRAVQAEGNARGMGGMKLFDSTRMDGCVVFPDNIAARYLEANYTVNTHLVPHRLPGMGLSVGDIVTHEGKTYLTMDVGVMAANVAALHLIRPHEVRYVEWREKDDELNKQLRNLIGRVQLHDNKCFGIEELRTFTRTSSAVGWSDVGTPSPEFLKAMKTLSRRLLCQKKKGMKKLAKEASMLVSDLKPYTVFQEVMVNIRKEAGHKGFPRVRNGMLSFTTPAASGGATLHTHMPSDDFSDAFPSGNDLFIVAAQAGNIPVCHIGGGSLTGEHYFMLPPRAPFFKVAQERLDNDAGLNALWQKLSKVSDFSSRKRAFEWTQAVNPLLSGVVKDVVPELVMERVLGLHVDMAKERRVALVRPVVSESHFASHETAIRSRNLSVIRPLLDDLLGDLGNGYGRFRHSVFN